jgi:hypothetical protein
MVASEADQIAPNNGYAGAGSAASHSATLRLARERQMCEYAREWRNQSLQIRAWSQSLTEQFDSGQGTQYSRLDHISSRRRALRQPAMPVPELVRGLLASPSNLMPLLGRLSLMPLR